MSSILAQIQAECANALSSDAYFANVQVVTQAIQDLGSVIDQALASLGVCAILIVPTAAVKWPNQPGPYFEEIKIIVRVVENVTVNQNTSGGGTGKGALEVAEYVCAVLHHFPPGSLSEVLNCESIALVADPERLIYDVAFSTQGGLAYTLPKLDAPAVTQTGETITIAAATSSNTTVPGAAIFYTVDGSFPSPRNGTLSTAPVSVSTGVTFRASAWLAGYLTSNITTHLCT